MVLKGGKINTDDNISHKKNFGQYFTPEPIAEFMANLFPVSHDELSVLDPGAGLGMLSCTFLNRICSEKWNNPKITLHAYDLDKTVISKLDKNLSSFKEKKEKYSYQIFDTDFLQKTSFEYSLGQNEKYSHIIMNPPYKKILSKSPAREYTRCFGLETVNMYSAFVGAAIAQLKDNGYLVAIVPRSFCNGVYYKPFREFILKNCAIKYIHLFESRNNAFKDDDVLQENIIIMLQKAARQGDVEISYSLGSDFSKLKKKTYSFYSIVAPDDKEKYFNIPLPLEKAENNFGSYTADFCSLKDIGVSVSTGAIVDFRLKDFLRQNPDACNVPLFYPVHFRNYKVDWPKESKRPNAICKANETSKLFLPSGYYVVVKRFSAKEERKRIVASIISAKDIESDFFAFENHLNVFHINKTGLVKDLAYGLVVWLNTTFLDEQFRLFSGHTQVNATDLRSLPYPEKFKLNEMGKELQKYENWNQELFDSIATEFINEERKAVNF